VRAVIQRVEKATVKVRGKVVGSIRLGLVVFLAVENGDQEKDVEFLKRKILNLRVFLDSRDKMNLSVLEVEGQVLVISQFTLYGDCRKGNKPSYSRAADPVWAEKLYRRLIEMISDEGVKTPSGKFRAMMRVEMVNDGPVTLIVDSKRKFY